MKVIFNFEKDVVVSETERSRVTLIPARGPAGAQGPQGETGPQGPAGADGATPVRGVDYWTAADQAAMAQAAGEAALAAVAPALEAKAPAILAEAVPGAVASFPDGADGGKVRALTIGIEPVQDGSGDPSPDNVRPITGWTGASVIVTGANLWGGTALASDLVAISSATQGSDDYGSYVRLAAAYASGKSFFSKFKPNTVYTVILTLKKNNTSGLTNLRIYYTDGTTQNIARNGREADVVETFVITTTAGKSIDYIGGANQSGNTYLYYDECGVFEGVLTAEDFAAYAGAAHPVSWETEAGTVYGGSVTLNPDGSADVSACPYYASYAGEALAGPWLSSMDVYSAGATPTTGAQVVDLGGEKTVTHVPAAWTPPMLTHLGANSAWADCGPIEALTYPADTKLYIDRGETEDDMTASAPIASGAYFQVGNALYQATAAIATGETITPGTNCTITTIADALNALAAQ